LGWAVVGGGRYTRYYNITVRREVYEELKRLADAHGLSLPDFLALVARTYNLVDTLSRLASLLEARQHAAGNPSTASRESPVDAVQQGQKPRRTSWQILEEQGVVCVSTMKARDPHKVIDVLRDSGAVVIASENDRCAVYPDIWASFVETLSKVGSPDEREVLGKLKGKAKQLFKMLRAAGAVHYDSKARRWVVDPGVVEEAGRVPGLAGAGGGEEAGGHVLRIPVEEAGDPEKYMAEMEKKGWLCNETAKQVICVWRETLEQAVVDLNSAGAGARDMEKVLAGDTAKLEVAKAAYEAGLLWYSSQEKRWKAAL
jgi:predicted CopG family antitoxin